MESRAGERSSCIACAIRTAAASKSQPSGTGEASSPPVVLETIEGQVESRMRA